jgi:hypothetical protein
MRTRALTASPVVFPAWLPAAHWRIERSRWSSFAIRFDCDAQGWVGLTTSDNLVVAVEQLGKGHFSVSSFEQAALINVRSKKLANIEHVHPIRKIWTFQ